MASAYIPTTYHLPALSPLSAQGGNRGGAGLWAWEGTFGLWGGRLLSNSPVKGRASQKVLLPQRRPRRVTSLQSGASNLALTCLLQSAAARVCPALSCSSPKRRHFSLPIQVLSVPRAWFSSDLLPGATLLLGPRCGPHAVPPVGRYAYVSGGLSHASTP